MQLMPIRNIPYATKSFFGIDPIQIRPHVVIRTSWPAEAKVKGHLGPSHKKYLILNAFLKSFLLCSELHLQLQHADRRRGHGVREL